MLAFDQLARTVSKELFRLPYRPDEIQGFVTFEGNAEKFSLSVIRLSKDGDSLIVRAFSDSGALQKRIAPDELRSLDPKTGQKLETTDDQAKEKKAGGMVEFHRAGSCKSHSKILPDRIEKKAKVGYEVTWSDGTKFIYSRRAIALAASGVYVE